jgi:hypothetical protein
MTVVRICSFKLRELNCDARNGQYEVLFFCLCAKAFSSVVGTTLPPTLWIPDSSAPVNLPWPETNRPPVYSAHCLEIDTRHIVVLSSARGHLQQFAVYLTMLSNCRMICD